MCWNPPDNSCTGTLPPSCDGSDVDLHLLHPAAAHDDPGSDGVLARDNGHTRPNGPPAEPLPPCSEACCAPDDRTPDPSGAIECCFCEPP